MRSLSILIIIFLTTLACGGCVHAPPKNVANICYIFREYPNWYWKTQTTEKFWHVPIAVQMAILHQESRFSAVARPARTKLLWIIPWKRPSSAFGYSQALNQTWINYQKQRGGASRSNFAKASDFVGWYANQANIKLGIAPADAYNLYLAYHEGIGGYGRKTFLKNPKVLALAKKVQLRADLYQAQLNSCAAKLPKKPWYKW